MLVLRCGISALLLLTLWQGEHVSVVAFYGELSCSVKRGVDIAKNFCSLTQYFVQLVELANFKMQTNGRLYLIGF